MLLSNLHAVKNNQLSPDLNGRGTKNNIKIISITLKFLRHWFSILIFFIPTAKQSMTNITNIHKHNLKILISFHISSSPCIPKSVTGKQMNVTTGHQDLVNTCNAAFFSSGIIININIERFDSLYP